MFLSVVGARPQFIKAAVVSRALARVGIEEHIVHTGQHYDDAMSGRFLRDLGIDNVMANLNCGSGTHAVQTSQMMVGLEAIMLECRRSIQAVIIYGDTNSSVAAALVASKLGLSVIHIEAGLRSFNREMPEEINRIVVDHLADLHFCSSHQGVEQLSREGICKHVFDVGDVMLDAFETFMPVAVDGPRPSFIHGGGFVIVTIHRPANTDDPRRLSAIIDALGNCDLRCIWPVHPRVRETIKRTSLPDNVVVTEPLSYFEMLAGLGRCELVVTDSGGLQKESYWAKKPCVTVRRETEWVETLNGRWNRLWDPLVEPNIDLSLMPTAEWSPLYGDGQASEKISALINAHYQ